jgi:hypothetical protein
MSQKYQGKKVHPLLGLKTTDSKIMDNIAQNIVIATPIATRLQIFILVVILNLPSPVLALFYTVFKNAKCLINYRARLIFQMSVPEITKLRPIL